MRKKLRLTQKTASQRDLSFPGWRDGIALKVGDKAETDRDSVIKVVTITDMRNDVCESGTCFRVRPAIGGVDLGAWFDAHWFRPLKERYNAPAKRAAESGSGFGAELGGNSRDYET